MRSLKPTTPRIYHRRGAPIAWYLMDSARQTFPGDTGDVGDITGGIPAGVRQGGCTWAQGDRGAALSFDGSSGQAAIPQLVGHAQPYTAIVRFNAASWANNPYFFYDPTGHTLSAQVFSGNIYQCDGGTPGAAPSTGAWHEYAVTYDGSSSILGYLDGLLYNVDTITFGTPATTWYLGSAGGGRCFDGLIDEFVVFDRVLSPAEIACEYADPFWRLRPPPRKTWWFSSVAAACGFAGVGPAFGSALATPAAPASSSLVSDGISPAFCSSLMAAASPAASSLAAAGEAAAFWSALIAAAAAGASSLSAADAASAYAAALLAPTAPPSSSLASGAIAAAYGQVLLTASAAGAALVSAGEVASGYLSALASAAAPANASLAAGAIGPSSSNVLLTPVGVSGCSIDAGAIASVYVAGFPAPSAAAGATFAVGSGAFAAAAAPLGSAPPSSAVFALASAAPDFAAISIHVSFTGVPSHSVFRSTGQRIGPDPRRSTGTGV